MWHRTTRALGHEYIGTVRLLLGLATQTDGVAADVLRGLGVTREAVLARDRSHRGSPALRGARRRAAAQAGATAVRRRSSRLGHTCANTEHVLLAIARLDEGSPRASCASWMQHRLASGRRQRRDSTSTANSVANGADLQNFYGGGLGFRVAMKMGSTVTFVSRKRDSAVEHHRRAAASGALPDLTVQVADVEHVHAEALRPGAQIVYPLTDERWGVRGFFLRTPRPGRYVMEHRGSVSRRDE